MTTLLDILRDLKGDMTIALTDGATTWFIPTLLSDDSLSDTDLDQPVFYGNDAIFSIGQDGGPRWQMYRIAHGKWNDDGEFEESEEE